MKTPYHRPKFVQRRNEYGFTLIEALFALSVFSIIIFFVTPIFQIMLTNIDPQSRVQAMEWDVFSSQFKKEVRSASSAQVLSGRLFLTKDADTIIYEKYGSNIRRRVNTTGHEIVLQNTADFSFILLNNAVKLTVKDSWGKEYSLKAYSLMKWNNAP